MATQPPLGTVSASVNYIADTARRQEVWADDFARNILDVSSAEMSVTAIAASAPAPALEREGFMLAHWATRVEDFENPSQWPLYRTELETLLLILTGSGRVDVKVQGSVRKTDQAGPSDGAAVAPIMLFAHCDFSDASVRPFIDFAFPPRDRKVKRMALYNVWRLLWSSPTHRPLAVCDARTVAETDYVAGP